jgi:hypothetical protein
LNRIKQSSIEEIVPTRSAIKTFSSNLETSFSSVSEKSFSSSSASKPNGRTLAHFSSTVLSPGVRTQISNTTRSDEQKPILKPMGSDTQARTGLDHSGSTRWTRSCNQPLHMQKSRVGKPISARSGTE